MLRNGRSLTMGLVFALSVAVIGGGTGCSGAAGDSKLVQVTGTVKKKDGTPIPGAEVTFTLKVGEGKPARGTTDEQGVYRLSTFHTVSDIDPGVYPGDYSVTITKITSSNPMGDMKGKGVAMKNMTDEEKKKVVQDAQSAIPGSTSNKEDIGDKGPIDAKDTEKKAREIGSELTSNALPDKYRNTATSGLSAKVEEGNTNPIDFVIDDK